MTTTADGSRGSAQPIPEDLYAAISELQAENGRRQTAISGGRVTLENLEARLSALAGRLQATRGPALFSRRRMIQWSVAATGAGIAGTAAVRAKPDQSAYLQTASDRSMSLASASATTTANPNIVIAPAPTGNATTDTANLLNALNVTAGTTVVLQASTSAVYVVDQELPVPKGVRVTGLGSSANGLLPTLRQAPGVQLYCLLGGYGYLAGLYGPPGSGAKPGRYQNATTWQQYNNGKELKVGQPSIEIDHIAFDGGNGGSGHGNTTGHGVVLYNSGGVVHDCFFVDIANVAIVVSDANWAGTLCVSEHFENRVVDNTIINPGWWGIWVMNTPRSIGCTDGYMINNVVRSPSKQQQSSGPNLRSTAPYEGIRMDNAAGWWVVNNRVSLCPGNGCYLNTTWGLHLIGNHVDGFGCHPQGTKATYTGFAIYCAGAVKTHPGFINENIASAYEGINPFGPPATETATFQYFSLIMQPGVPLNPSVQNASAWVEQANNAAVQASRTDPIGGATLVQGSTVITVPPGSVAGVVQPGMAVADITPGHGSYLAAGTVVTAVKPGTGSAPDHITISNAAVSSATSDTIRFPGPNSVGWTYINNVMVKVNGASVPSVLNVHRTNETITGTIDPVPHLPTSNKATVIITDPAASTAGVHQTTPTSPVVGQILVAKSATTADWTTLPAKAPTGNAGAMLGGTYPNPTWASNRISTYTASGTYAIPPTATRLRVTCVGGGGGGGGGGAAATAIAQVGGAGGAAGTTAEHVVDVGSQTFLTITVGPGGTAGLGAPAGGGANGRNGGAGGATTVAGPTTSVVGPGGQGGQGALSNSSAPVAGSAYGSVAGVTAASACGGCGGSSGLSGGCPIDFSPGGAGGGGSATSTHGGTGGGAGLPSGPGAPGGAGGSATTSGGPGSAASSPGAPGGGGGGGTNNTGSGGPGGNGSPGFAIVEVVG